MTLHHATVHCEDCNRDIEAYDCVGISELIQWLTDHNKYPQVKGLVLTVEDYQYLLNWGRK